MSKQRKPGKVLGQISDVLAAGGYIKVEAGTRVGRSSLRSYIEIDLYLHSARHVRTLSLLHLEQAARHGLIDATEHSNLPGRNCFDTTKRTARVFAKGTKPMVLEGVAA